MTEPPRPARRIVPPAKSAALLGLLVAVAFVIRIDALRNTALEVPEFGDSRAYHLLGENLAAGRGYIRPYEFREAGQVIRTAEYPPGLPVVLATADRLGVDTETGQRVVLCLVGSLTVGLVGLVGRRLGGEGAGLLAAAIAAIHPALWNLDVTLMAEPLAAFFGAAVLLAALAAIDDPRRGSWVVLGALAGLGTLVRSEFLLLGPALLVVAAVRVGGPSRVLARRAGWGVGVLLLVLLPWTVRNLATFGEVVPVSNNSGSVSRGANCDAAYRGAFRGLWVTDVALGSLEVDEARRGCFSGFGLRPGVNEAQAAAELRSDGVGYLIDHLDEVPVVVAARLGRSTGVYQLDQQSAFAGLEGRNVAWERKGARSFQVLAVVGLVGVIVAVRRRRLGDRVVLLVPPVVTAVTIAVTYGNPRFRAVAEPAVVVLAALALVDLVEAAGLSANRSRSGASAPAAEADQPDPGGTPQTAPH